MADNFSFPLLSGYLAGVVIFLLVLVDKWTIAEVIASLIVAAFWPVVLPASILRKWLR